MWAAWLVIAGSVCLVADIGWPLRGASWLALACTFSSYRRLVGLSERSVIAAGVDTQGHFIILGTAPSRRVRVHAVQSRKFGNLAWVLRFSTESGTCFRLLAPTLQEPRALRCWLRNAGAVRQGRGGAIRAPAGE